MFTHGDLSGIHLICTKYHCYTLILTYDVYTYKLNPNVNTKGGHLICINVLTVLFQKKCQKRLSEADELTCSLGYYT
jgi:hypothetical protein